MLIGYRDYVKDATLDVINSSAWGFEPGAPFSNAQDRRLAVVARSAGTVVNGMVMRVVFDEDKTIGIIALLNHNFDTPADAVFQVVFMDAMGSGVGPPVVTVYPVWLPPADSQFPRHMFLIPDAPVSGVRQLDISIGATGGSFTEVLQFGRVWAGPVWETSEESVSREDFDPRIVDPGFLNKSLGGQNYADVRQRYRQHTMRLPWLSEAEAIGTDDGLTQNLQDIAFEVGKTSPIIAIPSTANSQVIHKFGLYGTFLDPPSPRLIPESAERHYESTFDVVEEL